MTHSPKVHQWLPRLGAALASVAVLVALSAQPAPALAAPLANPKECTGPPANRPPTCPPKKRCYPIGSKKCKKSFELSEDRVSRGETITGTITGYEPGTDTEFTIASQERTLTTVTVDDQGQATVQLTIPSDIELGAHTVFAKGFGEDDGLALVLSEDVTVLAASAAGGTTESGSSGSSSSGTSGTSGSFARTGGTILPPLAAGVGLVAIGVALRRSVKRRKVATV